mmetsp:Transcript_17712/g.44528  ORF Transcript_17712/g.44528 Transcript_17712/m.44528 type:complete len:241 (-) Transcript_17712:46-768(-)
MWPIVVSYRVPRPRSSLGCALSAFLFAALCAAMCRTDGWVCSSAPLASFASHRAPPSTRASVASQTAVSCSTSAAESRDSSTTGSRCNGRSPPPSGWLGWAPWLRSSLMIAARGSCCAHAWCSGSTPAGPAPPTPTPASSSALTTGAWPVLTASCSEVSLLRRHGTRQSAPARSSTRAEGACAPPSATSSGGSALAMSALALRSAPAWMRRCSTWRRIAPSTGAYDAEGAATEGWPVPLS